MKFNIDGKLFQQQLQAVNKVINTKNAISILDNFLFELDGDTLTVTGNDQENIVSARLKVVDSEGNGAIAVPAKTLLEITKEISNQPIEFRLDESYGDIEINFLNGNFKFKGINAMEFPKGEEYEGEGKEFTVSGEVILQGLESTLYAVSQEPIRPIMTGVYWDIHTEDITFVASDTHKLVRFITHKATPGFDYGFIMPFKPASIIKSILKKDDEVKVKIGEKGAKFEFGDFSLSCRFIKGNYPNYNRVIPANNPFTVTIDRASFLNAMRRVAIFASKASNLVKMSMRAGGLLLEAQDLDYGTSAKETVMCDYDGNEMTIGFNSMYTIEILNNMPGESVMLKLSDPSRPGVFEPMKQPEESSLVIIEMPMQVID